MRHLLSQGFSLLARLVYPWERSLPAEETTAPESTAQAPQDAAVADADAEDSPDSAASDPAASSPPSPMCQKTSCRILTTFGYGILATSRSYLIGVRKLVRCEHAKMLAFKAAGARLPPELVDLIAEELFGLDAPVIQNKIDGRSEGFFWDPPEARKGLPAEREVQRQIDATGIVAIRMRRSRGPPNSLDPYTAGRTLLRIASPRIHLGIVPITTPSSIFPTSSSDDHTERESDHFRYGVEAVASYCCPPESGGQDYHSADFATYNRPVNIADTNEEMWGLSRYLHLGHLDEVVRSWDEEAVGKVVEMLGLDIVKASRWVREGEETRPMLVCFQSLGVGNERDDIWESINRG